MRSSREPKALTAHPKRCRNDMIMARTLSETRCVKLVSKSFISRVDEVLTRDSYFPRALRYDFTSIRLSKGLSPPAVETCSAHKPKGRSICSGPCLVIKIGCSCTYYLPNGTSSSCGRTSKKEDEARWPAAGSTLIPPRFLSRRRMMVKPPPAQKDSRDSRNWNR